jgi:quercetin dioxygenase-like cupin family protein
MRFYAAHLRLYPWRRAVKITNLQREERITVDMKGAKDVVKQVPLSRSDGAPNFSFRVFTIGPCGHTPYHKHNQEHLNYVISGRGFVVDEKGEEKPVQKGDFAMILPNEKHQYKNSSEREVLVMICAVPKEYE